MASKPYISIDLAEYWLHAMWIYGSLTFSQMLVLSGYTNTKIPRATLGFLASSGFVQHMTIRYRREKVWTLTEGGAAVGARLNGEDDTLISIKSRYAGFVKHDLMAIDVLIHAIQQSKPPSYGVTEWVGGRMAAQWYRRAQETNRFWLRPDGLGVWAMQWADRNLRATWPIRLELDRGTEPLRTIRAKANNYCRQVFLRDKALATVQVLFVTEKPGHVKGLMEALREGREDFLQEFSRNYVATDQDTLLRESKPFFWVTDYPTYMQTDPFTAKIWTGMAWQLQKKPDNLTATSLVTDVSLTQMKKDFSRQLISEELFVQPFRSQRSSLKSPFGGR